MPLEDDTQNESSMSESDDILECSICMDTICKNDYMTLDCTHIFHKECLAKWVGYSNKGGSLIDCPLCRATYKVRECTDHTQFLPATDYDIVHQAVPDTLDTTVSVMTLIKFYKRRQIIMMITLIDILVGFIRILVSNQSYSIMFDSILQILVSSYGFFGAMYLRSYYLMLYFVICIMSTAIRFLTLLTYLHNNVNVGALLEHSAILESSPNTVSGMFVFFLVASVIMQGWIAYITYRLRKDIIYFRQAFVQRFDIM